MPPLLHKVNLLSFLISKDELQRTPNKKSPLRKIFNSAIASLTTDFVIFHKTLSQNLPKRFVTVREPRMCLWTFIWLGTCFVVHSWKFLTYKRHETSMHKTEKITAESKSKKEWKMYRCHWNRANPAKGYHFGTTPAHLRLSGILTRTRNTN